jgi:hypothetical protein
MAVVRSPNFVVYAPDAEIAQQVADWAEAARGELLHRWEQGSGVRGQGSGAGDKTTVLFSPIPDPRPPTPTWPRPVTITVHRDHPGFFATEFGNDGVVSITLWAGDLHLESTVRHEVCHAVLHLRYPNRFIPRWFDEGLAVFQESPVEQQRQLSPLFRAERRFSVRQLAGLSEYPREVALFYAQSYSLVDFLIRRHGERELLRFLEASFKLGQEKALQQVLGYGSFEELERLWWADWLSRAQSASGVSGGVVNCYQ